MATGSPTGTGSRPSGDLDARRILDSAVASSVEAIRAVRTIEPALRAVATEIARRLQSGGRVITLGNGGSAAQAQHFAAELVGRFSEDRSALPATALTADGIALTALGNDIGFDEIFARQVEAFARPGDVVVALSTSGHSANVVAALKAARLRGASAVAVVGQRRSPAAEAANFVIATPADCTAAVQEAHLAIVHLVCRLVEYDLFGIGVGALTRVNGAVVDVEEAVRLRGVWSDRGMAVVWTNGCFDVLHAGHVRMLREARSFGDVLVVGVNDDASVRRLKGGDRPINRLEDRLAVLAALECVDLLVTVADDEPSAVIRLLRPDVACKGGDYADGARPVPEREVVEGLGGVFRTAGWTAGLSTTSTVRRLRDGIHAAQPGAAR